ncbi:TetR/AcrR family transcriptional regulator [Nocardioides humilatus]|uniref:TetR/AcrR family transcriptional regulator n=1 Tax=Nocardioides humilatus TaxID=2607660 RepID=A0A5B1LMA3_9ACTN|nr:TetR/AcrR family transcriptional regulator [Nocardioides humilatus]KAA1420930.1 TetR/AcrR family transcriptional regulator [Nocardioides humilatus]
MSSSVGDVTAVGGMRERLTEAAAALIATGGAASLSARKVAARAGTSTMSVYTHFGSMEALVLAVVEEGFARLARRFADLSDPDPATHLALQTVAYVENARDNPELYAVMFGVAPMGVYRPGAPERFDLGRRDTLDRVADVLGRAVAEGRVRDAGGSALAVRWWTIVHGYVLLESAGYLEPVRSAERVLGPLLVDLLVGEGDDPGRAAESVRRALTP